MATYAEKIAEFAERISFEQLSKEALTKLKHHLLDSIGCAVTSLDWGPVKATQEMVLHDYAPKADGACTLIGFGKNKKSSPQVAAFWNGTCVRYVDFMDGYVAKHQTCHPSDNVASILAASEHVKKSGKELLEALAVAYHVHCRLMDMMPVGKNGFDHTTQLGISIAAGASRALGMDREQITNAICMAGAASQGLEVTRQGQLSNWKGIASGNVALSAMNCVMLAKRGVTGPPLVFEGPDGMFQDFHEKFDIKWNKEDGERVRKSDIKKYNVEMHDQSLIEGLLELEEKEGFRSDEVKKILVETFKTAYDITGKGKLAGNKYIVRTKDQADHSIPYIAAVALLDGDVYPEQYRSDRLTRSDVQSLLRKVMIRHNPKYDKTFPDKLSCKISITLDSGRRLEIEKQDYEGFFTRPMPVDKVIQKFRRLTSKFMDLTLQDKLVDTVLNMEKSSTVELMEILSSVDHIGGRATEEMKPNVPVR